MSNVRIVCTDTTSSLAEEISGVLGVPLSKVDISTTEVNESRLQVKENMRGRDVFLVQSNGSPVNNNTIELFLILTALRRASARRVFAIIPYFAYARQTKKTSSRVPISAADFSKLLEEGAMVDHVVTVDIFREQIGGFFSARCCLDNLTYTPVAARYFWDKGIKSPVIVCPNAR